jgi:hypothetical protein
MPTPWNKDEIQSLYELIGTDETGEVIKAFKRLAKKNNWPDRTPEAVLIKIKRSGISRKPIDDGWNCTGLSEALGCSRDRVHHWVEQGLLKSKRRANKRHHRIKQEDFLEFAQRCPEWLTGLDRDRLEYLLPPELVDRIMALPLRMNGLAYIVKSNRTGKIYSSAKEAAKHEFLSRSRIAEIAKTSGRSRDGLSFELLGVSDRPSHRSSG